MRQILATLLVVGGLGLLLTMGVSEIATETFPIPETHSCTDSTHQTCDENCTCDSLGCELKTDTNELR